MIIDDIATNLATAEAAFAAVNADNVKLRAALAGATVLTPAQQAQLEDISTRLAAFRTAVTAGGANAGT